MKRFKQLPPDFDFAKIIESLETNFECKEFIKKENGQVIISRGPYVGVSVVHNTKKNWLVLLALAPSPTIPLVDLFFMGRQHTMEKEVENFITQNFDLNT